MGIKRKLIVSLLLFVVLFSMISTAENTSAKSLSKQKAVKVSHKYKMKKDGRGGAKQKVILCGKSKNGKVVWKFSSPYCICTELSNNDYFVNKNVIYLFSTKLYAVSKSTGKVQWPYKIKIVFGEIRVYVEDPNDEKQYYLIYNKHGKYLGKHIAA